MSDILRFDAPIEITAAADTSKPARISILAYSGQPMSIGGWGMVALDVTGIEACDVPILVDHRNELAGLIGSGTATKRGSTITVDGTLSRASEAASQIIAMAKDGVRFSASVGVEPDKAEHVRGGDRVTVNGKQITAPQAGLTVVRSGRLREVSVLPVGSDSGATVSISARGQQTMAKDKQTTTDDIDPLTGNALPAEEDRPLWMRSGVSTRDRVVARWKAARFVDTNIQAQIEPIMYAALAGEVDFMTFENRLLDGLLRDTQLKAIRDERPRGPAIHASTRDSRPELMTAAFCQSAGLPNLDKHFKPEVLEAVDSSKLRGIGLQEILLRAAHEGGCTELSIRSGNLREILRAAFSVHSLTTMLSTTGNKFLAEGFNQTEQVWRSISRRRPLQDFKTATIFRMNSSLVYDELPPGGEIHHGTVSQESYTLQAKTYAKMAAFTRTDIINDDLGALDDLRNRLGRGAGLKLNDVFWTAFLDNTTFFTAARANLLTTATYALAENGTALGAAEKLFMDLSDDDGHPLGIEPAILLVPTDLSVTARKLYSSAEIRDTTASTKYLVSNLYANRFRPLVSAYLGNSTMTGYSVTAWYLLADPANLPVMMIGFLDGSESPTIESADADFNELGVQFRGYYDFACAKAEWRAGVRADGA